MTQKFSNNARSLLQASINSSVTSLTVASADADLFPVANTGSSAVNTAGLDWFKATLEDSSGNIEVIYVRTRASGAAVFSNIQRGQDGTTARSFTAGAVVELRLTANDVEGAKDASGTSITDSGGYFSGLSNVEAALQFLGAQRLGRRNKLINGAMRIDQRNEGASITPLVSTESFGVDRWKTNQTQSSKFSMQRNAGSVTPPSGFTHYLGITSLSAYSVGSGDTFFLTQAVEGYSCADLAWGSADAQAVAISFWVYSSLTGTFGGAVVNGATNRSYPFSYSVSSANTWERKVILVPGDTSGTWATGSTAGMYLRFGLGSGSTYSGTAGAWASGNLAQPTGTVSVVGTSSANFYITGVKLEMGVAATNFELPWVGDDLRDCQRYWEKGYPQGVAPGTVSNGTTNPPSIAILAQAGSYLGTHVAFKTVKRVLGATITVYDNAGTANKISTNAGAGRTATVDYVSDVGFRVYVADATASILEGFWTADAEL